MAADGQEGLEKLRSGKYNVAFVDFLLPLINGITLVHQYKTWMAEREV